MRFRFRKYNEENNNYDYITSIEIEDFYTMYKTLLYMKEHGSCNSIELNTENIVDTLGKYYDVEEVSLSVSKDISEEGLIPIFVVDLV